MDRFWWQLPGPSRFVSRIVEDLRDGKNIVLCLPEHSAEDLANAIRSTLSNSEGWPWYTLHLRDEGWVEPAHLLFARFVPETPPDAIRNAYTLSQQETFAGRIIWLDGLTECSWPAWKTFLADYEHACRSRSLLERTLFCVSLRGELALDPPKEDLCLSHHYWRGIVDYLDMTVFISSIFRRKPLPALQKRIAIAVVTNLALWDPALGERLAHEDFERILRPLPILREIAREYAWYTTDGSPLQWTWHRGMIDTIEGEERPHSSALAASDAAREIERRIWSAEVGIMLPFVEERRQELLESLTWALKVPFTTRFGEVIIDVRDLEIGHIESQLIRNGELVSVELRRLVRHLREIRNCLSHLDPLKPELILSEEVNGWLEMRRKRSDLVPKRYAEKISRDTVGPGKQGV